MTAAPVRKLYNAATDNDAEETSDRQASNFATHVASLSLTKTGDALIDPKLVLAWLIGAVGAPGWMVGLLVPIRESLSLLPQIFTAGPITGLNQRKIAWIGGAIGQAVSVAVMAASALLLSGYAAGIGILTGLAAFALSRSVCSVSYKDTLARSLDKGTRGTATGLAGSVAAVLALAFGAALAFGLLPRTVGVIGTVLFVAAALWALSAIIFTRLDEKGSDGEDDTPPLSAMLDHLKDDHLRRFIVTRALLTATAFAPPFLVALGNGERDAATLAGTLGLFVISSALASIVSSYVWGRLSDRSSRRVLIYSAVSSATVLAGLSATAFLAPALTDVSYVLAAFHFALMIAYQGVRRGRSTHLTDMADDSNRAAWTALSNTLIGIVLLAGAAFSALAAIAGNIAVLAALSIMCAAAIWPALTLKEVQQTQDN